MDDFTIISTYTDQDALDDGMLWPLSAYDRITSNLGSTLRRYHTVEPLALLPVSAVLAVARQWVTSYGEQARRIYDLNLGGGIWVGALKTNAQGQWISLEPDTNLRDDTTTLTRVWMLPNELGGLTLMLPEDY